MFPRDVASAAAIPRTGFEVSATACPAHQTSAFPHRWWYPFERSLTSNWIRGAVLFGVWLSLTQELHYKFITLLSGLYLSISSILLQLFLFLVLMHNVCFFGDGEVGHFFLPFMRHNAQYFVEVYGIGTILICHDFLKSTHITFLQYTYHLSTDIHKKLIQFLLSASHQ